jgi:hypothetical protein
LGEVNHEMMEEEEKNKALEVSKEVHRFTKMKVQLEKAQDVKTWRERSQFTFTAVLEVA